MRVCDFDGTVDIADKTALIHRLRSVRRGRYGAFILSHQDLYPCLFVHFNDTLAYVHYFRSEDHPGFQPNGLPPDGCTQGGHFLQVDGSEADSIDVPPCAVVAADIALSAACDFLKSSALPPSVSWFEL